MYNMYIHDMYTYIYIYINVYVYIQYSDLPEGDIFCRNGVLGRLNPTMPLRGGVMSMSWEDPFKRFCRMRLAPSLMQNHSK